MRHWKPQVWILEPHDLVIRLGHCHDVKTGDLEKNKVTWHKPNSALGRLNPEGCLCSKVDYLLTIPREFKLYNHY